MEWFNVRRDGVALAVLALSLLMIVFGLSGTPRPFGFAVALFIGLLAGLGFVRRGITATWVPPVLVTLVLAISLAGAFAFEAVPVTSSADTVLGFQPGTAFVIYGIWLPALFTLGLTYVLLFDRLTHEPSTSSRRDRP